MFFKLILYASCNNFFVGSDCVKSVQIRSYFWSVFSCIRIECGDLISECSGSNLE